MVPAGEEIYAYSPSEAAQGAMAFYSGRSLKVIDSKEQICGLAAEGKPIRVIVEDSSQRPVNYERVRAMPLPFEWLLERPLGDRRFVRLARAFINE